MLISNSILLKSPMDSHSSFCFYRGVNRSPCVEVPGEDTSACSVYRSSVAPTLGIGGLLHVAIEWTVRLLLLQCMLLPSWAWCSFCSAEKSTSGKPRCLKMVAVCIFNRYLYPTQTFLKITVCLDVSASLSCPWKLRRLWFASSWCSTPVINSLFLEYGAYLHAYFII